MSPCGRRKKEEKEIVSNKNNNKKINKAFSVQGIAVGNLIEPSADSRDETKNSLAKSGQAEILLSRSFVPSSPSVSGSPRIN